MVIPYMFINFDLIERYMDRENNGNLPRSVSFPKYSKHWG